MESHPDTFCGHGRTKWGSRFEHLAVTSKSLLSYASLKYSSTCNLAFIASDPVLFLMASSISIAGHPVTPVGALRVGICAPKDRYTVASRRAEVVTIWRQFGDILSWTLSLMDDDC